MSTVTQALVSPRGVNPAPIAFASVAARIDTPTDLHDLLGDVADRAPGVALVVTQAGEIDSCEFCPTGGAFDPSDGIAIVAHRTNADTFLYRDAVCAEHAVTAIADAAGQQVWLELPYGPAPRLADVIPLQPRTAARQLDAVAGAR